MAAAAAAPAPAVGSDSEVSITSINGLTVYNDYTHRLQSIPKHSHPEPFLLDQFVQSRVQSVGTGQRSEGFIYEKDCQFQLQIRTGPLVHRDFHVQGGEEWYYVLQGDALLRLVDGRSVQDVSLSSQNCFLLPGGTPKSLQLASDCVLLVMTRQRKTDDNYPHFNRDNVVAHLTHLNANAREPHDPRDQMIWLCQQCGGVAHAVEFECTDYFLHVEELTAAFDESLNKGVQCKSCNAAYPIASKTVITDSDPKLNSVAAIQALLGPAKDLPASSPAFPTLDSSTHPPPYHLFDWIQSNRHLLPAGVGNKMIHGRGTQWKVMVVGGPNTRTDFHIDDGEEWFLQLEGDMTLRVVDDEGTRFREIHIKQGQSFLLPGNVPHRPERPAHTLGLVIERERFTHELDGLRWYCPNEQCREILRTFSFKCEDLGTQLKILIDYWYDPARKAERTCKKCGSADEKPERLEQIKQFQH